MPRYRYGSVDRYVKHKDMPEAERQLDQATHETRLNYMPGLDGLRAIAVAAVLLYHADLHWFQGGYLGVDVFFVLSGFLITSLLLAEWNKTGRVDLKAFWFRRARRLLPALFLVLVASLTFAVIFLPEEVAGLRNDAIAASTYVTNWYLVLAQKSYFEVIGRPSLFQHLWSLAVEEQFYLLWPLLFVFLMKFLRRWALAVILAGAAASASFMWLAYDPDVDPSRIYYGTDTRAAALLIGVALAFCLVPGRVAKLAAKAGPLTWLLDLGGMAALGAVVWYFVQLDETQSLVYQGGMLALETATGLIILALVFPGTRILPWLLGLPFMRWIGQRSYGIYLWHWPVFMVTRPQLDISLDDPALLLLRLGVSVVLASLSYKYVETPIRNGALGRAWREFRAGRSNYGGSPRLRWVGAIAAFLGFAILVGVPVVEARPPAVPDYLSIESTVSDELPGSAPGQGGGVWPTIVPAPDDAKPVEPVPTPTPGPEIEDSQIADENVDVPDASPTPTVTQPAAVEETTEPAVPTEQQQAEPTPDASPELPIAPSPTLAPVATQLPTTQPTAPDSGAKAISSLGRITAMGDSVMVGAAKNLKQLGDISVDAAVGRQVSTTINILKSYRDSGRLGPVVLMHIGNNGTFTAKQFDQMMKVLAGEKWVVFVNLKVPRSWEWGNNKVIMDGVARYPNTIMVDWRAASINHPELFWKDGIHLRPEGAKAYSKLIGDALRELANR